MKLKEFTVEGLKNLGNYENIKLSIKAELHDGDDTSQQIDDITKYINYKLNYKEWKGTYDKYKEALENLVTGDIDERTAEKYQTYVDRFDTLEAEIDEMKFLHVE